MRHPAPVPAPVRWWRLRPWSRNRLMRGGDRAEAVALLVTAMVLAALVPFAASFGTATYTRMQRQAEIVRTTVRPVPAVLLGDAHPAAHIEASLQHPEPGDSALARWSAAGRERTGVVPTAAGATAGQTVTVLVDAAGNLADPGRSGTQNAAVAVTAACGVWALGAGVANLVLVGLHRILLRQRMRRWDREWSRFGADPGQS